MRIGIAVALLFALVAPGLAAGEDLGIDLPKLKPPEEKPAEPPAAEPKAGDEDPFADDPK